MVDGRTPGWRHLLNITLILSVAKFQCYLVTPTGNPNLELYYWNNRGEISEGKDLRVDITVS